MAESYKSYSPYNYALNDPIGKLDPNGMWVETAGGYSTNKTDEIAAFLGQIRDNQKSNQDDPGWLQKMLSYFGWGTKGPKDAQEASEQSDRRDALISRNAKVEENMKVVEDLPVIGGLLKVSKGATGSFSGGKDYGDVIYGGGQTVSDFAGASALKAGGMLFIKGFGNVSKELFHRKFKQEILKLSGDFSRSVGKNPDIIVENGKVILKGVGDFKGKIFKTTVEASKIIK